MRAIKHFSPLPLRAGNVDYQSLVVKRLLSDIVLRKIRQSARPSQTTDHWESIIYLTKTASRFGVVTCVSRVAEAKQFNQVGISRSPPDFSSRVDKRLHVKAKSSNNFNLWKASESNLGLFGDLPGSFKSKASEQQEPRRVMEISSGSYPAFVFFLREIVLSKHKCIPVSCWV
jgi:hypothetical protein